MNTWFVLMAQYGSTAVIPVDAVCRDYFTHLTPEQLIRKIGAGDIALPLVRMEGSKKSAKGVHIGDLAKYIDDRRADAVKECEQLCGRPVL
ncbi:Pyocin activator protein PrtN [Burkholderia lata]|uniref:pyocin activator PrtN family protein n=1 Tax=Burkholderia lata (strain ATCC 17760 / DSM 23089 / LMG 22485 / NCIMB 9086 / R18194 / 383) TaxID=482957 RepID=UPI001453CA2D|nr:pyocin activator PrtN family protein [Burkholderia lata]VWC40504.1 Pyocin activator protein PrtN [Burkholderia lata]